MSYLPPLLILVPAFQFTDLPKSSAFLVSSGSFAAAASVPAPNAARNSNVSLFFFFLFSSKGDHYVIAWRAGPRWRAQWLQSNKEPENEPMGCGNGGADFTETVGGR